MAEAIAVAALSARMMAESAARGGFDVIAFDLFGDVDTRRAARAWSCIGAPNALRLDAEATADAIAALRSMPDCIGWVAGAGFESSPSNMMRCAHSVRLIGNPPERVHAVRDPATFFARLATMGIPHPEIALAPPAEPSGWLRKDALGSGGWHIRPAGEAAHPHGQPGVYFQRRHEGRPMSALFLAAGRDAQVIGVSELVVAPHDGLPFVYRGAIGPATVSPVVARDIGEAVRAIARQWRLVGLNSLDFLLDDERIFVLEVNARPSASMALYDDAVPRGLMRAHVEACLTGSLSTAMAARAAGCRGYSIVFADVTLRFPRSVCERWLGLGWCHDVPVPGASIERGGPVCSVTAHGRSVLEVRTQLATRSRQALVLLAASSDAVENEVTQ